MSKKNEISLFVGMDWAWNKGFEAGALSKESEIMRLIMENGSLIKQVNDLKDELKEERNRF